MEPSHDIRCEIFCQKGKQYTARFPLETDEYTDEAFSVRLIRRENDSCRLTSLRLQLKNNAFTENYNLAMDRPVRLWLPAAVPQKITALYLYSLWWTRPAFVQSFRDIPLHTQVALLQYPDKVACLVPMVGKLWKAQLAPGTDTELALELSCGMGGLSFIEEPLCLYTEAPTADKAIHAAFAHLAAEKGIALRQERRVPELFHYLGWCSWDAFYREVSEAGIRQKAAELAEKNVPVRWMIVDDGWLTVTHDTEQLWDFAPDAEKFPHGFKPLVEELRTRYNIQWLGVWHALAGFWGGVAPNSPVHNAVRDCLTTTASGKLVPDPKAAAAFYQRWYHLLRRQGISFAKVDGQSSTSVYFENSVPLTQAADGLGQALEAGASVLDGAVLNCMGMAMESILSRSCSALSRNSDDFFPQKEDGFVEHLLQNAYNSLYHNELYVCDWDMFWTSHPDAKKHALLRAISGGPVYVSDRVGETDAKVLHPLICPDGRLLEAERSAKPTADCIFQDPRQDGVLKLHNVWSCGSEKSGGIALYNLTDRAQAFYFAVADVPELDAARCYWVYDFFTRQATVLAAGSRYEGTMPANGYGWYALLPKGLHAAPLGFVEKYAGFAALEHIQETDTATLFVLRNQASLGWLTDKRPCKVTVNGVNCTSLLQINGPVQTLALAERCEKAIVSLEWSTSESPT